MNRWHRTLWLAALGVGMTSMAFGADSPSWWSSWFGGSRTAREAEAKKAMPSEPAESRAEFQARAKRDWERREAVCFKLAEIAVTTGDFNLARTVERLEKRAGELYLQQIGGDRPTPPAAKEQP